MQRLFRLFYTVPLRLRSLFGRKQVEQDLDDEIRYHLERQIETNISKGMTVEAARHAALAAMGGVDQRKEECRDTRGLNVLDSLVQDLRFGLRMLLKSPVFAAGAILTLGIGIGGITSIFSIVNGVLLRPLPYPDAGRLVMIWGRNPRFQDRGFLSPLDVEDFRQRSSFENVAAHRTGTFLWRTAENIEAEGIPAAYINREMFAVLRVQPMIGRAFQSEDFYTDTPSVILSYGLWQRRFGADPSVVGKSIKLSTQSITVVGVMPPDFRFYGLAIPFGDAPSLAVQPQIFLPLTISPALAQLGRRIQLLHVTARLKSGASLEMAQNDLNVLAVRIQQESPNVRNSGFRVTPLKTDVIASARTIVLLFFAAVAVVLLMSITNVANLFITRAINREREIALRLAIGSTPRRLIRMLLTEGILLSAAGGLTGLILAQTGVRLLVLHLPSGFPRVDDIAIDMRVFVFTALIAAVAGIAFGLVPGMLVSKVDLDRRLREGSRGFTEAGRHLNLRRVLIAGQVGFAVVLLVSGGLVGKSLWRLLTQELGMDSANLLRVSIATRQGQRNRTEGLEFYNNIVTRLKAVPAILSASYGLPGTASFAVTAEHSAEHSIDEKKTAVLYGEVATNYFQTMGVPMLRGRPFNENKLTEVVVNDRMASELWPGTDPVGRQFLAGDAPPGPDNPWLTVAGVIRDFKTAPSVDDFKPEFFGPCGLMAAVSFQCNGMYLIVKTAGDPVSVIPLVKAEIAAVDPNAVLTNVETSEQMLDRTVAAPRFRTTLFMVFAVVAQFLAFVGIYGVTSYSAAQRVREVGLRIALGATPSEIRRAMILQAMKPIVIGTSAGILVALAVTRLLTSYLFQVTPTDPWVFIAAALLVAAVALIANSIPIRRASSIDPMTALRYE